MRITVVCLIVIPIVLGFPTNEENKEVLVNIENDSFEDVDDSLESPNDDDDDDDGIKERFFFRFI